MGEDDETPDVTEKEQLDAAMLEGCECEKEREIKKREEALAAEEALRVNTEYKADPEKKVILEVSRAPASELPSEVVEGEEQEVDDADGDPVGEGTG